MGSVSQKILDKGDYFQLENDSWTLQKDEFTDSNTAAWKKGDYFQLENDSWTLQKDEF